MENLTSYSINFEEKTIILNANDSTTSHYQKILQFLK